MKTYCVLNSKEITKKYLIYLHGKFSKRFVAKLLKPPFHIPLQKISQIVL